MVVQSISGIAALSRSNTPAIRHCKISMLGPDLGTRASCPHPVAASGRIRHSLPPGRLSVRQLSGRDPASRVAARPGLSVVRLHSSLTLRRIRETSS